jgi:uncharacterized protein with GYD domain
MAINVTLATFTDQGIRSIKDSPKRAQAFRDLAKKNGVTVREMLWTLGTYDLVVVTEGSEEAMAATMLTIAKLGNVRTTTLRAMDAETFQRVLEKVT